MISELVNCVNVTFDYQHLDDLGSDCKPLLALISQTREHVTIGDLGLYLNSH